jgi:hypothetical protein
MMQMNGLLPHAVLLTCVLCFPLHTHASDTSVQYYRHLLRAHQLRAVEKRLQEYLSKRVLVFRKGEISRDKIRFDSRGRATESGLELKSHPNAILFMSLTLDPEHLVILGEAARIRPGAPQPTLSRDTREFRLVNCTITLDIPPDEMTFTHTIGLLCRIFLTREEL